MTIVKPCPICAGSRGNYERTLNQIDLVQCANCSFVFANIPDDFILAHNLHLGDDVSHLYQARQNFIDRIWFNMISDRLMLGRDSGRVVDIGCGNGQLLRQFVERGWDAAGVDPSPWAVQFATKYGYKLYASELHHSGFANDFFDIVTNTSTLEHIPDPRHHLKEVIRILKPGGMALFSGMPNYGSIVVRCNASRFQSNQPPGHVNYFTPRSLRYLLNDPEITSKLVHVRIRSYGIPELFWVYRTGLKLLTLVRRSGKGHIALSKPVKSNEHLPTWKYHLGYLITRVFYHAGRPGGLGDKLEVVITKAQ